MADEASGCIARQAVMWRTFVGPKDQLHLRSFVCSCENGTQLDNSAFRFPLGLEFPTYCSGYTAGL